MAFSKKGPKDYVKSCNCMDLPALQDFEARFAKMLQNGGDYLSPS
jgi:hypothetical protein